MSDRKRKRPRVVQAQEQPVAPDEEGFVYAVAGWPAPWPPAELTGYFDSPVKGGRLQMLATAQGNLVLLLLNRDGTAVHQFTSQPIAVLNLGYKVVKFTWTIEGLSVVLGSRSLAALSDSDDLFFLELGSDARTNTKSYEDDGAESACAREVKLRENRYRASASVGDIQKTLEQELVSLSDSLRALQEDVVRVRAGERHRQSAMRAALRELVVNLGAHYQPLLFRVAAKLALPLPIYAMPKGSLVDLFSDVSFGFEPGSFGIEREWDSQVLVDLEEWLRRPVARSDNPKKKYLFQDLVAKAAEFLGGAHAPPGVPPLVHTLSTSNVGGTDQLTSLLLKLAEVVQALGSFVLERAAQKRTV